MHRSAWLDGMLNAANDQVNDPGHLPANLDQLQSAFRRRFRRSSIEMILENPFREMIKSVEHSAEGAGGADMLQQHNTTTFFYHTPQFRKGQAGIRNGAENQGGEGGIEFVPAERQILSVRIHQVIANALSIRAAKHFERDLRRYSELGIGVIDKVRTGPASKFQDACVGRQFGKGFASVASEPDPLERCENRVIVFGKAVVDRHGIILTIRGDDPPIYAVSRLYVIIQTL